MFLTPSTFSPQTGSKIDSVVAIMASSSTSHSAIGIVASVPVEDFAGPVAMETLVSTPPLLLPLPLSLPTLRLLCDDDNDVAEGCCERVAVPSLTLTSSMML